MALGLTATTSPDVQQDLAGTTSAVLTWTSRAYAADEVIEIFVGSNWDSGTNGPANVGTPSGGGTWALIVQQDGAAGSGGGTVSSAWRYVVPAGGQTFAITQTTTRGTGNTNVSSRGVMRRWSGADTTDPDGNTDTYLSATTDPLTSASNLDIAVSAGSIVCAGGCDWLASTACTTSFDSGLTRVDDINSLEAGQCRFISIRSNAPIGGADASVRAGFDITAPGANGNWSAIIYELKAAASAAPGPARLRRPRIYLKMR